MRTRFHHNLDQLTERLRTTCELDHRAIEHATGALLTADLDRAEQAINLCVRVAGMREASEHAAMTLLALQAPVASELRRVVTAIQLVGDLTRMGSLANHIALIARRRHPGRAVPEAVEPVIARMGAVAAAVAESAAAVLNSCDPYDAAQLDNQDDAMDQLYGSVLDAVLAPDFDGGVIAAVDLALSARYYERFADHAVEVGRRTIFMTTGELKSTVRQAYRA
ncbi:phosphate signaling complex protein PhoU [Nocardia sp. NPDC059240]|uniref:phosphate signaling complex protein PhoU n=1 Tax=Nocardia sp. NPDC059240 TaxID=3346786 RepID=UPI003689E6BA